MTRWFPVLSLMLACSEASPDSGAPAVVEDSGEPEHEEERDDCEEISIKVIGDEPPSVGDTWTVYLNCDAAVLTGTTVVRVDPVDLATIDDNVITWDLAGEGTLRVQVGNMRVEDTVVVSD